VRTVLAVLRRSFLLSFVLAGIGPERVQGQITAGINATVSILTLPLTGMGTRALQFGVIVPGTTTVTVLPRSSAGGEFRIAGVKTRKSVDISFTLPTQLTGPAGASIPLSFNGNYAGLCEIDTSGACVLASYVTWNPVSTPTFRDNPTRFQPGRKVYAYDQYQVYLGGVATPAATQRQGTYTASIGVLLVIN
jgi:hypothetical protein